MAQGRKPSPEEKVNIRDLIKQGLRISDLQERYPDVDGRILSGMYRRQVQITEGSLVVAEPGTMMPAAPPQGMQEPPTPQEPFLTPPPAIVQPPMANVPQARGFTPAPAPAVPGPGPAGDQLGFTQVRQPGVLASGLRPSDREYHIITKMNEPGRGIVGQEFPPFNLPELFKRYPPGEYEIKHFVDGRAWATYRETIAPNGMNGHATVSGGPAIVREAAPSVNPYQSFAQAMDVSQRLIAQGRADAEHSNAAKASAETARETAKVTAESNLTNGVLALAKEALNRPQPESSADKGMERVLLVMEADRKNAEDRHARELERMREQQKLDLEVLKAKNESDERKLKDELAHREKMQNDLLERRASADREHAERLAKLDQERQQMYKDSYEKLTNNLNGLGESLQADFKERQKHLEQMTAMEKKHILELADLKTKSAGSDKEIEVAKIIRDGITGGLDRIGARIDTLANAGIIKLPGAQQRQLPGGAQTAVQAPPPPPAAPAAGAAAAPKPGDGVPAEETPPEKPMPTPKEVIAEALASEWFQDLKNEISITLKRRVKVEGMDLDPKLKRASKPHGNVLAQNLIDQINKDRSLQRFIPYIMSREWPAVLADISDMLKSMEERDLFNHAEATVWWEEFQIYITQSWNMSMGISE